MQLTFSQFVEIAPRCPSALIWAKLLEETITNFKITSPCAFIAVACHESQEFTKLTENLNYSSERLLAIWPKRFNTRLAHLYASNPEALANFVYADRLGNGNQSSGDGWKYRGRGIVQLTGKTNYQACGQALNLDLVNNPDLLLEPKHACDSFGWYWNMRKFNSIKPMDREGFYKLNQRINGTAGDPIGWGQRLEYWKKAVKVFEN